MCFGCSAEQVSKAAETGFLFFLFLFLDRLGWGGVGALGDSGRGGSG